MSSTAPVTLDISQCPEETRKFELISQWDKLNFSLHFTENQSDIEPGRAVLSRRQSEAPAAGSEYPDKGICRSRRPDRGQYTGGYRW